MKDAKTILFKAKKIITMNATRPEGEAVAVRNGIILGVGSLEEMKGFGAAEVDETFRDLVLVPGLIEAHSHVHEGTHWGFPYIGYYDRVGPDGTLHRGVTSFGAVLEKLKSLDAAMSNSDEPLIAWGFDPIFFEDDWLNVTHLDSVSKTRPILIFHISAHLATVNSALMRVMDITKETDVPGVHLGPDGELSGELREPYALRLAGHFYTDISDGSADDRNWMTYATQAKNAGCTTIAEMAYGSPETQAEVDRLQRMIGDPEFPVRIAQLYLPLKNNIADHDKAAEWAVELGKQSTAKLRLGIIKYFLDGSIQGFTARLREPGYLHGNPNGMWITPPEELYSTLLSYHRQRLSMHCHCNGDEAIDVFLDAVERVQAEKPWLDHRHTVHHSQLTSPSQYRRMARLGVSANIFSNHIYYWGEKHYNITVGPDRAHRMNACKTAGEMGVNYTMHSDAPVTPISQIHSIWAAVNRQTSAGRVLGENERISVYDALRAVTIGAAYTLRMDQEVGSIEPGKLADFTVLEESPFDVDPFAIRDIKVWGTVLGGKPFQGASVSR